MDTMKGQRPPRPKADGFHKADFKGRLLKLLAEKNNMHATLEKVVLHSTRKARAGAVRRAFGQLRKMGIKLDSPYSLCGRHVALLMQYWSADPQLPAQLAARGIGPDKFEVRAQPQGTAYIRQQLSALRVLANWIGKPGMVLRAEKYVCDPALVGRRRNAEGKKPWSTNGVDIEAVLARVASIDKNVAVQLEIALEYDLQRKEAVMLKPSLAEVPRHALPAGTADNNRYLAFLRIKRGTKGGRLRYIAIHTPTQERALERAREVARTVDGHIGRPGLSLQQSLDLFSNVIRAAGVTRAVLGVTAHGLRHQFANDLFFDLTHVTSPVRGREPGADPETVRDAYLEVARQLRHGRPRIAGAYLSNQASMFVLGAAPADRVPEDAPENPPPVPADD